MKRRGGFSLFEVMVAMAICVAGLALVWQMLNSAELFSNKSTAAINSQIICQNKINRIAAGLDDWEEIRQEECEENADFWYAVHSSPHQLLPLQIVEVTVWPKTAAEKRGSSVVARSPSELSRRPGEFRLGCFIERVPDPSEKNSPLTSSETKR